MKYRFDINPIPKVRMTNRSKWTEKAQACLAYQQAIADLCRVHNVPRLGTALLELHVKFVRNARLADWDNLVKAFCDGLQYGGVFENDNQIRRTEIEVEYTKDKPYIEFTIEAIDL